MSYCRHLLSHGVSRGALRFLSAGLDEVKNNTRAGWQTQTILSLNIRPPSAGYSMRKNYRLQRVT